MHSIPSFVSILFSFFRRVLVLFRQFSNVVGSSVDKVPFQWARYNNNNRSKPVHLQQQSIISVPLPSTAAASLVDDKNIIDPPVSKITNSFVSFWFFSPSCSSTFRPFHERRRPFCSLLTIRCHGYCFLVDGFEWYYYGIGIVVSAPTTTYLSC